MPSGTLRSPIGTILVEADGAWLTAIRILPDTTPLPPADGTPLIADALAQLDAFFRGGCPAFDLPLLPPRSPRGAALRQAIRDIPHGGTISYGALARQAGSSARAIGQACARNPFPLVIPCHRVLGAGGAIGHYSAGLGTATKSWLLDHEQRSIAMGETITLPGLGGTEAIPAYRADPADKPRGAIVLIPEVFGINRGIRARADALAATGYVVLAPEIFWRVAPGKQLDPDVPSHLEEAIEDMKRYDQVAGIRDLEATIRHARDLAGGRKVGVVGYCFGGLLAYLCATRTDTDASVGYYGGGIDAALGEAHAISNPLLLHFAEGDHFIPAEARAKVHAALDGNAHVTIHEYPGVDHGFATSFGSRRDDAAATLADARTEAFFAEHIG